LGNFACDLSKLYNNIAMNYKKAGIVNLSGSINTLSVAGRRKHASRCRDTTFIASTAFKILTDCHLFKFIYLMLIKKERVRHQCCEIKLKW